jgi:peroxiredoxin (alkyl hydroperoxide reductase subunit C)
METMHLPLPLIGRSIPDLEIHYFQGGKEHKEKLSKFYGKWTILFFYPADFTFVCPTELEDLAHHYTEFQALNAEILSVSTDTVFVHKAWHDNSPAIRQIDFPMVADPTGRLCQLLGTYIPEEGLSLRGTFIIDPDGVIQAYEVHSNNIGRSAIELLRKLQAAIFVRENGGEVCPANWHPGSQTLKPGMDLVGKL